MTLSKQSVKAGSLFPQDCSCDVYDDHWEPLPGNAGQMREEEAAKAIVHTEEFRRDLLNNVMGGKEDAPIQCRYCLRWFTLAEVDVDHGTALSRGGSTGLDNIDYPCAQDNDRKGSLSVAAYTDLLAYLDKIHPLDRQDVLSRLEKANKLAASAARARGLMAELERLRKGEQKPKQQDSEYFSELPEF